jgi:hypothetical protein
MSIAKKEFAVLTVLKVDRAYRSTILNDSERGLWKKGEKFFSRQLKSYAPGTVLNVTIRLSETGRKMVQKVEIAKESSVATIAIGIDSGKIPFLVEEQTKFFPKVKIVAKDKKPLEKPLVSLQGYYVSHEARLAFSTALKMSNKKPERCVKMMMIGPSGYGKTTLPRLFAEIAGKKFMRMNCATVRDPEEWFGFREARDGNTVFVRSQFAEAIAQGNLVIVLDEFNRLEPWLHNTLFPLLDDDGCTVVHGEEFHVGPGVIVVGTINTGYRYTGTFELDEALLNRFEFMLEVGPMPQADERKVLSQRISVDDATAQQIVRMCTLLRQQDIVCSTRTSLLIASMVVNGMTLREAFEYAVILRIPVDNSGSGQRKQVIDLVNTQIGTFDVRKIEDDIFKGAPGSELLEDETALVAETTRRGTQLRFKRRTGVTFLRIQIIQELRSLPILGKGETSLTLREAQSYVEKMEREEEVTLDITPGECDLVPLAAKFYSYGVEMEF